MIGASVLAWVFLQAVPHVVNRLDTAEVARAGLVVELIERPAGVDAAEFAQRLIDAEGLQPSRGAPIGGGDGDVAFKTLWAGDGRSITVHYSTAENTQMTGRACRIRASDVGHSEGSWQAFRWCRAAFGVSTPDRPPPPIVAAPR